MSLAFGGLTVVDICDATAELLKVQCYDQGGSLLCLLRNPSDSKDER